MNSRRIFIKQIGLGAAGLMVSPGFLSAAELLDLPGILPRSTPEIQGVSSEVLNRLFDAMHFSDIEFHSVMVLRNGFVIGEGWWAPYAPGYKHTLHSLSKSFTSAAVGMAIAEGYFTVDSPVISFFPESAPKEISANLAAMQVKHLLTMTTGHASDTGLRGNAVPWVQSILAAPVAHAPGTFYTYNTSATYLLSAVVQKTTGKTLLEFLKPRLFKPLKIEGADWEVSPQGINTGGFGLRIRTEDIASFSQLYLNKGKWNGKQLLPEAWVEASTKAQWTFNANPFGGKTPKENDDWQQGYGYQFWRTLHNGFRSDGLYGQFGIVLPDQQTVVAITEQSFNTQKTLNLIWDILLPGLQNAPLTPNSSAHKILKVKERDLQVKFPAGGLISSIAGSVSGKKFILDTNNLGAQAVTFNLKSNSCELIVQYYEGERKLNFGMNTWKNNGNLLHARLPFPANGLPNISSVVMGNATWQDATALFLAIRPVETVTSDSITCTFTGDTVRLTFLNSVARGNAGREQETRPELTGRIV